MEEVKELMWMAATKTVDVQTNQRHRVVFYAKGYDIVIKFERLDEKDGRKSYTTLAELNIPELGNSGFENFFSTAISKLNAVRTDDQETRYSEILLNHFEQGKLNVLRFSYSISAGQKSDFKRTRMAVLKLYTFGNYQEAKPYMVRNANGAYDQLPETNCIYTLNLKLMPKLITTGMGGRNVTEAESFLQDMHALITSLHAANVYARMIKHIDMEDETYIKTKAQYVQDAVAQVRTQQTSEAAQTNIQVAPSDNYEDEFPF